MAYSLQKNAPSASDPTAKNRVWDFFAESNRTRPVNRRQPLEPRRKNRPCSYKTASGRPYWPSRDPIGDIMFRRQYNREKNITERQRLEQAALAPVYVFVENQPVNLIDNLGLDRYITQFDILGLSGPGADGVGIGGTQLHVGVAADIWYEENGKFVKKGQVTYGFSTDYARVGKDTDDLIDDDGGFAFRNLDWWNIISSTVWGRGLITMTMGLELEEPIKVPSSPCQDRKMLQILEKERMSPPLYSAIAHGCIFSIY